MATQKQNFIDTQIRPLVELLEKVNIRISVARAQLPLLDPPIVNDATLYDDGRPDENLDQVTEGQLSSVFTGLASMQDDVLDPAASLLRAIAVRNPME